MLSVLLRYTGSDTPLVSSNSSYYFWEFLGTNSHFNVLYKSFDIIPSRILKQHYRGIMNLIKHQSFIYLSFGSPLPRINNGFWILLMITSNNIYNTMTRRITTPHSLYWIIIKFTVVTGQTSSWSVGNILQTLIISASWGCNGMSTTEQDYMFPIVNKIVSV